MRTGNPEIRKALGLCVNSSANQYTETNVIYFLFSLLTIKSLYMFSAVARGGAVVLALRYKPKGRGIESRWCYWNFSLT
jgi:hypothetical protein